MGDTSPTPPLKLEPSPAGEVLRKDFLKRLTARLDEYRNLPLNILVWGAGAGSTSPARKKREDIKSELNKLNHNAMFSEDLESYGTDLPLTVVEKAQVETVDMVIVLMEDAPGTIAEVQRFATQAHLSKKFCIMIPKNYDGGFVGKDITDLISPQVQNVFWYTSEELARCDVLTHALKQVRIKQNQILITDSGRGKGEHGL